MPENIWLTNAHPTKGLCTRTAQNTGSRVWPPNFSATSKATLMGGLSGVFLGARTIQTSILMSTYMTSVSPRVGSVVAQDGKTNLPRHTENTMAGRIGIQFEQQGNGKRLQQASSWKCRQQAVHRSLSGRVRPSNEGSGHLSQHAEKTCCATQRLHRQKICTWASFLIRRGGASPKSSGCVFGASTSTAALGRHDECGPSA